MRRSGNLGNELLIHSRRHGGRRPRGQRRRCGRRCRSGTDGYHAHSWNSWCRTMGDRRDRCRSYHLLEEGAVQDQQSCVVGGGWGCAGLPGGHLQGISVRVVGAGSRPSLGNGRGGRQSPRGEGVVGQNSELIRNGEAQLARCVEGAAHRFHLGRLKVAFRLLSLLGAWIIRARG
jgi:hypothetical protein